MAGDWVVSRELPEDLRDAAAESSELFSDPQWSPVLQALGASTKFAWSPTLGFPVQLAIFRRVGIPIGYLGFPIAGERFDGLDDEEIDDIVSKIQAIERLPLLRVVRSRRGKVKQVDTAAFPEAIIEGLKGWSPDTKRLRKDLAFAQRSAANLEIRAACVDPKVCHELYIDTVKSHHGKARYTPAYFHKLCHLAEHDHRLRFYTAVDLEERVCGFSTVVQNGVTAYYLHGAVSGHYRRTGIGDRLVQRMIQGASDMGCQRLSMMASPWDQPGLHTYKMKWCGDQRLVTTTDYACGLAGRVVRMVARSSTRDARQQAQNWNAQG